MSSPILRLRYIDEGHGPAPRLEYELGGRRGTIALSDRARWVLIAISLPRGLLPESASEERQRLRLGSQVWSSGEIMARIPYQHRSTIRLGLADLRQELDAAGLSLEDHLLIDTTRGRYGLQPDRTVVDLVALLEARDSPADIDRLLDDGIEDRRRARLADVCGDLLEPSVLGELHALVAESAARTPSLPGAESPPSAEIPPSAETASSPTAPGPPAAADRRAQWRTPRRWLPAVALVLAAAVVTLVLTVDAGGHTRAHPGSRAEYAGGLAHTWSNPKLAEGRAGKELVAGESVLITCRLKGFKVQDGNVWWYRIGSAPWSDHFYATADAFYNNGHRSGSLIGSKFVDLKVPLCS